MDFISGEYGLAFSLIFMISGYFFRREIIQFLNRGGGALPAQPQAARPYEQPAEPEPIPSDEMIRIKV
jgi:hypothetical protein